MKFSSFVEGFLGLQGATSGLGGDVRTDGLARSVRHDRLSQYARYHPHAARPVVDDTAAAKAAMSFAIAIAEARRAAAATASPIRAVETPAPKPAVLVAAAAAAQAPPPPNQAPPPAGPAEPEVPVAEIVAPPPAVEAYAAPPPVAAAAAPVYDVSAGFDLGWLNGVRWAANGGPPLSIGGAMEANVRFTNTLGENVHNLGEHTGGQAVAPSLNERCNREALAAANLPSWSTVETALRVFMCENRANAATDCDRLLSAVRMNTAGITIHYNILTDPKYTRIFCTCNNIDNGGSCQQDSKCTCDLN